MKSDASPRSSALESRMSDPSVQKSESPSFYSYMSSFKKIETLLEDQLTVFQLWISANATSSDHGLIRFGRAAKAAPALHSMQLY